MGITPHWKVEEERRLKEKGERKVKCFVSAFQGFFYAFIVICPLLFHWGWLRYWLKVRGIESSEISKQFHSAEALI